MQLNVNYSQIKPVNEFGSVVGVSYRRVSIVIFDTE